MFNLPEFKEPFVLFTGKAVGRPASSLRPGRDDAGTTSGNFRPHNCTAEDAARFSRNGRPSNRAALRRKHFRRMEGRESHLTTNPKTGAVIGHIPLRAERRRLSRAFAAGEWKKNKAVA